MLVAWVPSVIGAKIRPCRRAFVGDDGVLTICDVAPPVLIWALAVICPALVVTTWTYPIPAVPDVVVAISTVPTVDTVPDTDFISFNLYV